MPSMNKPFAYINHGFIPESEACLHISDLSIQRGYGVFEFFRVQEGRPLFRDEHLERFYASASLMELAVPFEREELSALIDELITRNHIEQAGIKLILTGGYSPNGYTPTTPNLLMVQTEIALPTPEQVAKGMKIMTHEYIREVPRAKTINYSMGILLLKTLKERGLDDVLYRQNGRVTEFPRSSFFLVKQDGTLVTPADDVLLGVTRNHVLSLAAQTGKAETGTVTLEDIAHAKEAFTTSTTKRIMPIVEIDGRPVGDGKAGPHTLALLQGLIQMENQQHSP